MTIAPAAPECELHPTRPGSQGSGSEVQTGKCTRCKKQVLSEQWGLEEFADTSLWIKPPLCPFVGHCLLKSTAVSI